MSKVVNRSQQLRVAGMNPESEYSRVVSALAVVKAPAVNAIGYTAALGNRLRLKQIRCWFVPEWTTATAWHDFMFRKGQQLPTTYAQMTAWDDIMPINWLGSPRAMWRRCMFPNMLVWDMNRLFVGEAIRFGIQVEVSPEVTYLEMYTSFQISEG